MKRKTLKKVKYLLLTAVMVLSILVGSIEGAFAVKGAQLLSVESSINGNEITYQVKIDKEKAIEHSGQNEEELFLLNQFSDNENIIGDLNLNGTSLTKGSQWDIMVDSNNEETKIASLNFSTLADGENTLIIKTTLIDGAIGGSLYSQVANGMATSYVENIETVEAPQKDKTEISPMYIPGGVDVTTWSDFVAKVQDPSVTAINVMNDLTNNTGGTAYTIPSKNLVIDGNGHTINFGSGAQNAASFVTGTSGTGSLTITNAVVNRTGTTSIAMNQVAYFFQVNSGANWDVVLDGVTSTSLSKAVRNANSSTGTISFKGVNEFNGNDTVFYGFENYIFDNDTQTKITSQNGETISAASARSFTTKGGSAVTVSDGAAATLTNRRTILLGSGTNPILLTVEANSVLNIDYNNTQGAHDSNIQYTAPLAFLGNGTQSMVVKGEVNVNSKNGTGIAFETDSLGKKDFTVDGGVVNITCATTAASSVDVPNQYAALAMYSGVAATGNTIVKDINVINDGKLNINTTGHRAISNAGGIRSINVSGANSEMNLIGGNWGIASERPEGGTTRSQFYLNVTDGAKVLIDTSQAARTDGSSVYIVAGGVANVTVDGAESELIIKHGTSIYSSWFHDGVASSTAEWNITNGGLMDVYSANGGRTAINFQSLSSAGATINVSGYGIGSNGMKVYSRLNAVAEGNIAAIGRSYSAFPVNINVKDSGVLYAKSNANGSKYGSATSTIELGQGGLLTLDNPKAFDIINTQTAMNGKAVATASGTNAINIRNTGISSWNVRQNPYDIDTMYAT